MPDRPTLLRMLTLAEARAGIEYVLEHVPADAYIHGHVGAGPLNEATVRALLDLGVTIYRYTNLLHVDERAPAWPGSTEALVFHIFERRDAWLRHPAGTLARFRYAFGSPLPPPLNHDRIMDWGHPALRYEDIDEIAAHVRRAHPRGPYFCDQTWLDYDSWMVDPDGPGVARTPEDRMRWRAKIFDMLYRLGWPGPGCLINGDREIDRYPDARMLYECADFRYYHGPYWAVAKRWTERPGSALGIDGRPDHAHVPYTIRLWLREGGILFPEHAATAALAWSSKPRLTPDNRR